MKPLHTLKEELWPLSSSYFSVIIRIPPRQKTQDCNYRNSGICVIITMAVHHTASYIHSFGSLQAPLLFCIVRNHQRQALWQIDRKLVDTLDVFVTCAFSGTFLTSCPWSLSEVSWRISGPLVFHVLVRWSEKPSLSHSRHNMDGSLRLIIIFKSVTQPLVFAWKSLCDWLLYYTGPVDDSRIQLVVSYPRFCSVLCILALCAV